MVYGLLTQAEICIGKSHKYQRRSAKRRELKSGEKKKDVKHHKPLNDVKKQTKEHG